jgi:thiol-disulfide isomerase/thioredoxin
MKPCGSVLEIAMKSLKLTKLSVTACLILLSCGFVLPANAADQAAPRTKDQILADINAAPLPQLDREKIKDSAYVRQYITDHNTAAAKRGELTQELYLAAPNASELDKLLPERWNWLIGSRKAPQAISEIDAYLSSHPSSSNVLSFATLRARMDIQLVAKTTPERLKAIDEFKKYASGPQAGNTVASLLYTTARMSKDDAEKKELTDRIVKEYPNSPVVAQIEGEERKADAAGKPMVLAFNEAITGKPMSIAGLKGKIVVMDFWATWCGPCVAEMPTMKKLYAEFKDKGVEFVGVSLDQPEEKGGLKSLKDFCAKNEITWPQYYQGNFWQSEFSTKWGIFAIPCVFVIGPDGTIVTTEARGKLETLLPELIKKRDAANVS